MSRLLRDILCELVVCCIGALHIQIYPSIFGYVLQLRIDGACAALRGRHGSGASADGGVRPRSLVHVAARALAWRPESIRAQRVPRGESAARSKCCDATGSTPAAYHRNSCSFLRLIDAHAGGAQECDSESASKALSRARRIARFIPHILLVLWVCAFRLECIQLVTLH